jgi:hypothetical protein
VSISPQTLLWIIMAGHLKLIEKYLERAVEEFETTSLATQLMRRLATESPEFFLTAAMKYLNTNEQSNAHRLMTVLVLRRDDLLDQLASPAFGTRETAIKLFQRFSAVDPAFDVKMARRLPGRSYWSQSDAFDVAQSTRALDILDETSRGRRLVPILGHLPENPDSRISAKATLFVGRRVQNPAWTAKQLTKPDERVRANAVEALWGVNSQPAVKLLEDCVADRNNRVVGNALVGLHIAGNDGVPTEVLMLSRDGKPEKRCTAAWAMGRIGLPNLTPRLTELIRDEHPQVRGMALRSMLQMRRLEVKLPEPKTAEQMVATLAAVSGTLVKPENAPGYGISLDGTSYAIRRR